MSRTGYSIKRYNLPTSASLNLRQLFIGRENSDGCGSVRLSSPVCQGLFARITTLSNVDSSDKAAAFRFPPLKGNTLIVGDGDFAYSVAFADANRIGGTATITAASLDTKAVVENKYSNGKRNLDSLASDSSVRVRHGLDITEPKSLDSGGKLWDNIVWNFPYPPYTKVASSVELSFLLTKFISNVRYGLKPDGAVYITLVTRQAGREFLDLEALVQKYEFFVCEVLPFRPSLIDGYEPKRAYIDENIPDCNYSTYKMNIGCSNRITNICKLLEEAGGELNIGTMKQRYENQFGAIANQLKWKQYIEHLSCWGKFQVKRRDTSSWVIVSSGISDHLTKEKIRILL